MDPGAQAAGSTTSNWQPPSSANLQTTFCNRDEQIADRILEDMAAAWGDGRRPLVEDYLSRHPHLANQAAIVLRLIHGELCLRQQHGLDAQRASYVRRFPRWSNEIGALFDLHRSEEFQARGPVFPECGEVLGGFRLEAVLGRGGRGVVYLARQPALADRLVVLKLTVSDGQEHVALARLLHSNIVPLYGIQDFPARRLRAMCMPFLGGASLDAVLNRLEDLPIEKRSGKDLVRVLDELDGRSLVPSARRGPARDLLARVSYVQAICWLGAALADALHHAHERGLLHLDVKPSNVLLASDGQPMLLDFHLARPPLKKGDPLPRWFGGTPDFMSPEQRQVLSSASRQSQIATDIDGRSDVYSLGVVLYTALGGPLQAGSHQRKPLHQINRTVGVGLSDIIHKCLADDPKNRYASAASVAADLRRHLADLPLRGVRNRSWRERFHKWHRRQPQGLARIGIVVTLILATTVLAGTAWRYRQGRLQQAQMTWNLGRESLSRRDYQRAIQLLNASRALLQASYGDAALIQAVSKDLRRATHAQAVDNLHQLAERVRMISGLEPLPKAELRKLEQRCVEAWLRRGDFLVPELLDGNDGLREAIETDLLDLCVIGADLQTQLADADQADEARRQALAWLDKAENSLGSRLILSLERQKHAERLGDVGLARAAQRKALRQRASSAWERYVVGRHYFMLGQYDSAVENLRRAIDADPKYFWAHFVLGITEYRRKRYDDALLAFHACVVLDPGRAECFYQRALTYAALGEDDLALKDYDRALRFNPPMAKALLNRGILHLKARRFQSALGDFRAALEYGAEPARTHYNLAVTYREIGDVDNARRHVQQALAVSPQLEPARRLAEQLQASP